MSNATANHAEEFGPIRKLLWPIYKHELKKFLPLCFIMFCILFNYTLLRDTKDTLVVNSAGAGAITFLKLYCVTPMAILFVIVYAKLSNILSRENVFYAVITPFLVFFGLFAFVLYPNLDVLHPSKEWIEHTTENYPMFSGFINIIGYWAYSLFYVLAEIWGSAMIALMFWQFANHVVRMKESKRFYGLFMTIGNVALIFSGQCVRFCSQDIKQFYPGTDTWQISLYLMMTTVVIMGIVAMFLYRWMHLHVLTDPLYFDATESMGKTKKKKEKPGLKESFKIIISSPELGLIAILIMAYGVTINLVEVQWKGQLGIYCAGDKGAYNAFMGNFSTFNGIGTILFSWLVGSNILRILSWFKAAVITPAFILIGGGVFFCFILSADIPLFKNMVENILTVFSTTPITAAAYLGAIVVLLSKTVKYSLFDPTKEMAYIPLDDELKTKGKAAVDVIGGRAGKAGGAFVQSTLLIIFATSDVIAIAPHAFAVFMVVALLWIFAVKVLSVKVGIAMEKKDEELRREADIKRETKNNSGPLAQPA